MNFEPNKHQKRFHATNATKKQPMPHALVPGSQWGQVLKYQFFFLMRTVPSASSPAGKSVGSDFLTFVVGIIVKDRADSLNPRL